MKLYPSTTYIKLKTILSSSLVDFLLCMYVFIPALFNLCSDDGDSKPLRNATSFFQNRCYTAKTLSSQCVYIFNQCASSIFQQNDIS